MAKVVDTTWQNGKRHPGDDELLLHLDGELAEREETEVSAHLEACWSCRVRIENFQATISAFVNYRNHVLQPLTKPGPHCRSRFETELDKVLNEGGRRNWLAVIRESLSRLGKTRFLSFDSTLLIRSAVALSTLAVMVAVFFWANQVRTVSASELLGKAADEQSRRLREVAQPVIHQKIQVRLKRAKAAAEEKLAWEIWHDTTQARLQQVVDDGQGRRPISDAGEVAAKSGDQRKPAAPRMLADLRQILEANYLDPRHPLSPAAYETWRKTLGLKREAVTKETRDRGLAVLKLTTEPQQTIPVGGIMLAQLVARAHDFHPIEQRLLIKQEQGNDEYVLTETAFEVVNLTSVSREVFPERSATPAATPSPAVEKAKEESIPAKPVAPASVAASTELELEVLRLLNSVGADLGEQVNVVRTAEGILEVQGLVETQERKEAIMRALDPVNQNPAVKVTISTVTEALAQKRAPKRPSQPAPIEHLSATTETIAVHDELRQYLLKKKGVSEAEVEAQIRKFAQRTLDRSFQSVQHASALKRLAERFTPEQLGELDDEGWGKWLLLMQGHAQTLRRETAALRQEIRPLLFPEVQTEVANRVDEIADVAGLKQAVDEIYKLCTSSEEIIRAAFSITPDDTKAPAIKTLEFWRALTKTEKLAERLHAVKLQRSQAVKR